MMYAPIFDLRCEHWTNLFHQVRTFSWLISMPRSWSKSSTCRSESGNRTYIVTAKRMISGDVLKYRNGFLIQKRYEIAAITSSKFPLTTLANKISSSVCLIIQRCKLPCSSRSTSPFCADGTSFQNDRRNLLGRDSISHRPDEKNDRHRRPDDGERRGNAETREIGEAISAWPHD